jgi:RHS repeat-associated protein
LRKPNEKNTQLLFCGTLCYAPSNCQLSTVNWTHTFSAKEKDSETGLSYFGSRYYSSDLSIWLSVDPQSNKYPSFSPYVYCANNPIKLVDPNGEDWFENELTGDVYYNRDYRKGDEKSLEGKGWKWMGSNNMFDKSDNDAINSNSDKVSDVSCRQDGVDGIANATFTGDNAEAFMNNMGYEKRPLVQDVSVKSVTQTFPDAMGPNSFSHTETSEYVIKTHSWTYAKNTSAIRYSVLSRKNVKDDINFFTSTHTYSATERRMYDYSMSSKKQSVIDACIEVIKTISKMF